MSEFDDWKEEQERIHNDYDAENAWYAGQQSQQAKINELQKRIDEITNHVGINFDEERDDDQHSYWSGYNQAMRELNDILKGNKDEN